MLKRGNSRLRQRPDLFVPAGRDKHAGVGRAGLSTVQHTGRYRAFHGGLKVGVIEDDAGRLAAQFERHALDRLLRGREEK